MVSGEKEPKHDLQLCTDCHVPSDCVSLTDASADVLSSLSLDRRPHSWLFFSIAAYCDGDSTSDSGVQYSPQAIWPVFQT